jgi:hypothetical protein
MVTGLSLDATRLQDAIIEGAASGLYGHAPKVC